MSAQNRNENRKKLHCELNPWAHLLLVRLVGGQGMDVGMFRLGDAYLRLPRQR